MKPMNQSEPLNSAGHYDSAASIDGCLPLFFLFDLIVIYGKVEAASINLTSNPMALKTRISAYGGSQAVPAGYVTEAVSQPLPGSGALPPAVQQPGDRFIAAAATKNDGLTKTRSHVNAALSGRLPVAAPRCQDADPTANVGVPITTENGFPVAPKGSTLR